MLTLIGCTCETYTMNGESGFIFYNLIFNITGVIDMK